MIFDHQIHLPQCSSYRSWHWFALFIFIIFQPCQQTNITYKIYLSFLLFVCLGKKITVNTLHCNK